MSQIWNNHQRYFWVTIFLQIIHFYPTLRLFLMVIRMYGLYMYLQYYFHPSLTYLLGESKHYWFFFLGKFSTLFYQITNLIHPFMHGASFRDINWWYIRVPIVCLLLNKFQTHWMIKIYHEKFMTCLLHSGSVYGFRMLYWCLILYVIYVKSHQQTWSQ